MKKGYLILIAVLMIITALAMCSCADEQTEEPLKDFRLIVPKGWELNEGDSRSVDYVFEASITNRKISWSVTPSSVASVDKWGRVSAKACGIAWVTATTADNLSDRVLLFVTPNILTQSSTVRKVDYTLTAASYGTNAQKIVTRFEKADANIPSAISSISDFTEYQTISTKDGAVWEITDYGVLRTDHSASNTRDKEQRFMGDRYFYEKDTTLGKVLGIVPDGENGIWTIMTTGITHIEMLELNGEDKAATMSHATEEYVTRRGMVAESHLQADGTWKSSESDNDGLWTSMYGAGELMRYATLKNSPTASAEEIADARKSATISTEAVLLLANMCMRTGTTEAYIRYQPNARFDEANGRYYSEVALEKDGDYSLNAPYCSPADAFTAAYEQYLADGTMTYFLKDDYLYPYVSEDWSDPLETEGIEYEKRTRILEGFVSRTYSFKDEGNATDGYMHWSFNDDGTATGVSHKSEDSLGYRLNGENLRGVVVDASGDIPDRLWNDLIGEGYSIDDIVYKGDTSHDELIGHLFIYKLAFDILGPEDAELKQIIVNTMDKLAQHISDNDYMMVDGTGQPTTWSKFNRYFFYNSSQLGGAPLTSAVILSLFKLAGYVTGDPKWEAEYRMAALDPAYEYAEVMGQYSEQCHMVMLTLVDDITPIIKKSFDISYGSALSEMLTRLFLNYSDEEMAMLAFYLLFQMEDDEALLTYYRAAIDDWWISIQYSENPLWYYIYQLAYPNEEKKDAYGNSIIETAAWSLSRHPVDTRKYAASNTSRDDVGEFSLRDLGIEEGSILSYDISGEDAYMPESGIIGIIKALDEGPSLDWAVAAPDERALHKYNGESYQLNGNYSPNEMEGATTFSLPYWMGRYHGMLK